ncbi:hypothetical protein ACI65C_004085 [Semiaphis heraclei]
MKKCLLQLSKSVPKKNVYPDPKIMNMDFEQAVIQASKTASCLGYHLINLPSELSSDHSPVLIDIHHHSAHVSPPKPLYFTNWQKYETDMESKLLLFPPLSTEDQINSAIQITDFISENVKSNSVTHNPSDRKSNLPPVIRSQIIKKRKLRSIWQRTRNPAIKTLLNH